MARRTALTGKVFVPLIGPDEVVPKPFDQTNGKVDFDTQAGDRGGAGRWTRIFRAGVIAHGFMGGAR